MNTIEPFQLAQKRSHEQIDLIDVRTPAEFREIHAEFAKNAPLDSLDPAALMQSRGPRIREPLYVICQSGSRGSKACKRFIDAGFEQVVNVSGGTKAWDEAGLPVVRGKKTISLERQVRIVAGSIVLIASLLAMAIHPYFAGISAFIGAGLTFAGLTDTCGMGMMLAKMPWNQVNESESCAV